MRNNPFIKWLTLSVSILLLAACGQVATVGVTSVTINEGDQTVEVGNTFDFSASVEATGGADESVTWSSGSTSVATVDPDTGVVTAVAAGESTITATSDVNPDAFDTVTVTVPGPAVTSVAINEDAATIDVGATVTYTVTVQAQGGATEAVTWSSSATSVATVDPVTGVVTGQSDGSATITATSDFDGSVTDSVSVRVLTAADLDNIFVDASATEPQNGSATYPFDTLQEAVTAVNSGGTVNVATGTYTDAVAIDKSVSFLGAQANTLTSRGVSGTESRVTGQISIAGDGIDVSFNGFQLRSGANPSITSTGSDHSVSFTYNLFDNNIRQIRLNAPSSVQFEQNIVLGSLDTTGGLLQVSGDWNGTTGTSVSITDNVMEFDFTTEASPAINVSSVTGTIAGNSIDMLGVFAGQDNTRIAILIAGTSGSLTVSGNDIANANQGIRFAFISADGLGPVTIDGNTIGTNGAVRQGIVVDADGDVNNVTVTNNTIANVEEGIRLLQAGLSISTNTFNGASVAYVIDETGGYDLNAILADNTYTPAATVGTAGGFNAIVQQ